MLSVTNGSPSEVDWLHAIGHPYRVEIMRRFLATGTATPTDVAHALALPLGSVSYHIRSLAERGIIRLAGRTQRRGASVQHYQLTDRQRVASVLWGIRATLLVTDFERENGRGDATAALDPEAFAELRALTGAYLARIGELGLQTRERRNADDARHPALTQVAVLLATDEGGEIVTPAWR
ncbi:MAG TPA: winged helix-turn-helix domain-containing protein [Conexibacter sp.]|nr:winged helix-turn-helix domain-containing protein [Conexibacter sp.]